MNISEGNKLIANFMNLARDDTDKDFGPGYIVNDYKISDRFIVKTDVDYCSPEELPYHLSWDWLIPVISKISKLPSLGDIKFPRTGPLGIYTNINYNIPDINNTYVAVVEFIKWYNKNYLV